MPSSTTLNEANRTIDGTEYIRLATPGANWRAQLGSQTWIFGGVAGGNAANSVLTLESTTGAGTSDVISFLTGSQIEVAHFISNGDFGSGLGLGGFGAQWFLGHSGNCSVGSSLQAPLVVGGAAVGSTLTIESTSAVGTSDSIVLKTGSQVQRLLLDTSGNIIVGTAALATSATNGFLYIDTCAGAPTGVPTSYTGRDAIVFDTTNNKLWVYNAAWKNVADGFDGVLGVANGGTGDTTLTTNGVLYGNTTSAIQVTAQGGANTVLTANAGAPSFSAAPTIGTSVTTPLIIGGTAASSSLTLESTSGAGTTDFISFKTASQTQALYIDTSQHVIVGTSVSTSYAGTQTAGPFQTQVTGVSNQTNNRWGADNNAALVELCKSVNNTIGTHSAVDPTTNPAIGSVYFGGSDGTAFKLAASIQVICDATVSAGIVPGRFSIYTANTSGTNTERVRVNSAGNCGIGHAPTSTLDVAGSFASQANTTVTASTYTVAATDTAIAFQTSANCTVTLPSASSCPGRWLHFKTMAAFTITSASANVDPIGGGGLGSAILAATVGKWCIMQANSSFWEIMASN